MLREFFDRLVDHSKAALAPVTLPDGRTQLRDGSLWARPAAPRAPTLLGLDDVVALCLDAQICPSPEVYVSTRSISSTAAVSVLLDRGARHERAHLILPASPQMVSVMRTGSGLSLSVPDALAFLRVDLYGSGVDVGWLRAISFKSSTAANYALLHGKESLGRSVEAEVAGASAAIPEGIVVMVPAWNIPGLQHVEVSIPLAVGLDAANEKISLRALPGAIEAAQNSATLTLISLLRDRLDERSVPVFGGAP